jgi:hypothetical protein
MVRLVSVFLLSLICFIGCATRTKYKPMAKDGGYAETEISNNLYMVRFAGNAHTNRNDANLFTYLRAIEICTEKGFKVARVYETKDLSTSQTVQKTSNYSYNSPTYFSATANTNTNYQAFGNQLSSNSNTAINGQITGGNSYGGSQRWNQTTFPTFDMLFSCKNNFYLVGIQMEPVPPENVKEVSKDNVGALQIIGFTNDSPNKDDLQVGDIILKVEGRRVVNMVQLSEALENAKDKNKVTLTVGREGKRKSVSVVAEDKIDALLKNQEQSIQSACVVPEIKKRQICSN